MKTIIIRIRYSTWKAIRRIFKAFRNESAADYMERLKEELER